jgi:hypothetical protein
MCAGAVEEHGTSGGREHAYLTSSHSLGYACGHASDDACRNKRDMEDGKRSREGGKPARALAAAAKGRGGTEDGEDFLRRLERTLAANDVRGFPNAAQEPVHSSSLQQVWNERSLGHGDAGPVPGTGCERTSLEANTTRPFDLDPASSLLCGSRQVVGESVNPSATVQRPLAVVATQVAKTLMLRHMV